MKKNNKYYLYLDIIRIISCISVLLYHLGILKGGFLAVNTFFVLSGYLATISTLSKEKFNIFAYYKNRLLKIYLPFIIVVFLSIGTISLFKDITWINLKPETVSTILGYNNFWQINANLDYFTRVTDSPFTHFWYISILLQYELIFPLLCLGFKKVKDIFGKRAPIVLSTFLGLISIIFFYKFNIDGNMTMIYYNSIGRAFSWLFGITLGLIHHYSRPKVISNNKIIHILIFYLYMSLLILLFVFISPDSQYFFTSMIISTLISLRLISYSKSLKTVTQNVLQKSVTNISKITYEVYLWQYPVIFIFNNITLTNNLKLPFIIIITIILSILLHFILSKQHKFNILKMCLRVLISWCVIFGIYEFIISKDYTKDMQELESLLAQNENLMDERNKEYESNYQAKLDELENALQELENDKANLDKVIKNLPIVGIGDSVMLGAVDNLYKMFPNSYFDAKVSRSVWTLNGILTNLKNENRLGNPVIVNLGANGDCTSTCKANIMSTLKDKLVFWINVTNDKDVHFNAGLNKLADTYDNLYVIDWESISKGHKEYFYADGLHLTIKGRIAYTEAIYESIYKVYENEYIIKQEEIINNHNTSIKNKITFYGSEVLLNAYEDLSNTFSEDLFLIDKNFTYDSLVQKIQDSLDKDTLTSKIVLVLDKGVLSKKQYEMIINLCSNSEVYVVALEDLNGINLNETNIINFYQEINSNKDYLMVDKIHLTEKGNKALIDALSNVLLDKQDS